MIGDVVVVVGVVVKVNFSNHNAAMCFTRLAKAFFNFVHFAAFFLLYHDVKQFGLPLSGLMEFILSTTKVLIPI